VLHLSAYAAVFHYDKALYQVYVPLPLTWEICFELDRKNWSVNNYLSRAYTTSWDADRRIGGLYCDLECDLWVKKNYIGRGAAGVLKWDRVYLIILFGDSERLLSFMVDTLS